MDDVLKKLDARLETVESDVSDIKVQVSGLVATIPHLATKAQVSELAAMMGNFATKAQLSEVAAVIPHLATKEDLRRVETSVSKIETMVSKMETSILKWIVGTVIAAVSVVFVIARYVNG